MTKLLTTLLFFTSFITHAGLIIQPTADMPITTVNGLEIIDLTRIEAGSPISFDIIMPPFHYTLAAMEFSVYYPPQMLTLSEQASDWENNLVFIPSPDLTSKVQLLPINEITQRLPAHPQNNLEGSIRLGLIFKKPDERWEPNSEGRHPGGHLGTIYFHQKSQSCTSYLESVQILMGPTYEDGFYDFVANENGERMVVNSNTDVDLYGQEGVYSYIGNPLARIRFDANNNGFRNPRDALNCLRCAIYGPDSTSCSSGIWSLPENRPYFSQVFDANCDGIVNNDDVGIMLDVTARRRSKPYNVYETETQVAKASTKTAINLKNKNNTIAQIAVLSVSHQGELGKATIKGKADGWDLIQVPGDVVSTLILFHEEESKVVPNIFLEKYKSRKIKIRHVSAINAEGLLKEYEITQTEE